MLRILNGPRLPSRPKLRVIMNCIKIHNSLAGQKGKREGRPTQNKTQEPDCTHTVGVTTVGSKAQKAQAQSPRLKGSKGPRLKSPRLKGPSTKHKHAHKGHSEGRAFAQAARRSARGTSVWT